MDSGAFLHITSKNALERDSVMKSKEPTVNISANGKAESTEEANVHVDDSGGFTPRALSGFIVHGSGLLL